jgi:hypothetical protein
LAEHKEKTASIEHAIKEREEKLALQEKLLQQREDMLKKETYSLSKLGERKGSLRSVQYCIICVDISAVNYYHQGEI